MKEFTTTRCSIYLYCYGGGTVMAQPVLTLLQEDIERYCGRLRARALQIPTEAVLQYFNSTSLSSGPHMIREHCSVKTTDLFITSQHSAKSSLSV